MKYGLILALLLASITNLEAQKYFTRGGHIWFFSGAALEDIEAHNHQANSIVDIESGDMAFTVLMKGFEFEKALMQEHFNEKYVHSDDFPKAQFKGTFPMDGFDAAAEAEQTVKVTGDLTIHGVTQSVETEAILQMKDDKLIGKALFKVAVADYGIKVPEVVRNNIAEIVDIHVEMEYERFEK